MIWIIGGTSEGREMVSRLGNLENFIVTVATDEGKEFLGVKNLHVGRLTYEEMGEFIDDNKIKLIVDLTHPFAVVVSSNAKNIAKEKGIDYARYVRPRLEDIDEDIVILDSYEEAYKYLENIVGTVFFTTGSKNIKDFEKVRGENRFIYRILPATESIELAKLSNIAMKDIIAVLGPFSHNYNLVMFKEYNVDYCVTKDSGKKGGLEEKLSAAKEAGIKTILIGREKENGYDNLDDIEKIIRSISL